VITPTTAQNGCHTDSGGISVFIEKLSGIDVSFVDMTALGRSSPTRLSLVTADPPDNYRKPKKRGEPSPF
jgi:hypothetical protein